MVKGIEHGFQKLPLLEGLQRLKRSNDAHRVWGLKFGI